MSTHIIAARWRCMQKVTFWATWNVAHYFCNWACWVKHDMSWDSTMAVHGCRVNVQIWSLPRMSPEKNRLSHGLCTLEQVRVNLNVLLLSHCPAGMYYNNLPTFYCWVKVGVFWFPNSRNTSFNDLNNPPPKQHQLPESE